MSRIRYTLKQAWHYRRELTRLGKDNTWHLACVTGLTIDFLKQRNITHLALDFDGVLAPHGDEVPLPVVVEWLHALVTQFAEARIYILSNKPMPAREAWFKQYFPQIQFIKDVRKKPYPDGLAQILAHADIPARQLMLVDDRLLTGILATIIVGARGLWIVKAYRQHLRSGLFAEIFFSVIRGLEKVWFKR